MQSVDTISNRLKTAMELRNIKQIELVEKTNIPKGSISQYVTGYVEPKSDRIYLLAKALAVDPVWLMGMDVPMERYTQSNAEFTAKITSDPIFTSYAKKVFYADENIKEQIYSYIDFLLSK